MRTVTRKRFYHEILRVILVLACCVVPLCWGGGVRAETTINIEAKNLAPKHESALFFSPASGTFLDDATFEVSVYLDTQDSNVNAVELHVQFDPNMLSIVKPSSGTSIIGIWAEPPSYDNTKGTVKIVGVIPNGIKTNSGLITTILFKAKRTGNASISVTDTSKVLLNDGMGTATDLARGRALLVISPKASAGVAVYSDTHPAQDSWYNNNSPVLTWETDPGITGFSVAFDDKPTTIPDNVVSTTDTIKGYQNVADGVWYFHVKAFKRGVWSATTHYAVRIDTTPPAVFAPTINYLSAAAAARFLVSFFTTDALSGIDYYEIGIIDRLVPVTESPLFVEAESPYQLPFDATQKARVIVRAYDKAGNVRDASVDAEVPFMPFVIIEKYSLEILTIVLGVMTLILLLRYVINRRTIRRLERAYAVFTKQDEVPVSYNEVATDMHIPTAQSSTVTTPVRSLSTMPPPETPLTIRL